jgi:predicted metal-dependent phosphoesterase TrpH
VKRIDLHTHSYASKDGGLSSVHYRNMLASGQLDMVAVTDHNRIDAAVQLHNELGDVIIIGEEISTRDGDVIGLYLKAAVPAGLPAAETAALIHQQGGLVYIPHPFDQLRSSTGRGFLSQLQGKIDIIEIFNGRMIRHDQNKAAQHWATVHHIPGAASSDAHGWNGWGSTCTIIDDAPTAALPGLLLHATFQQRRPTVRAKLYPNYHRLRHWLGRG